MNPNLKQAIQFFGVTNMEASVRFYVDGLGFVITGERAIRRNSLWKERSLTVRVTGTTAHGFVVVVSLLTA